MVSIQPVKDPFCQWVLEEYDSKGHFEDFINHPYVMRRKLSLLLNSIIEEANQEEILMIIAIIAFLVTFKFDCLFGTSLEDVSCILQVVKYMAKRRCRCHGTSGMCALQTCAGSLPTLKDVGTTLRYLYELAHKGVVHKHKELRLSGKVDAIELGDVLVYLSKSPDYCKRNTSYGLQGTLGRVCRVPHRGSTRGSMKGHCNTLCFSCGYTIKYEVKPRKVRCNCKFKWCCHVKCERCLQGEDVLVCHKR